MTLWRTQRGAITRMQKPRNNVSVSSSLIFASKRGKADRAKPPRRARLDGRSGENAKLTRCFRVRFRVVLGSAKRGLRAPEKLSAADVGPTLALNRKIKNPKCKQPKCCSSSHPVVRTFGGATSVCSTLCRRWTSVEVLTQCEAFRLFWPIPPTYEVKSFFFSSFWDS